MNPKYALRHVDGFEKACRRHAKGIMKAWKYEWMWTCVVWFWG
jgi:hypothetical protein